MCQQKGEDVGGNTHEVEDAKSEDSKRRYQELAAGEKGSNGSMKEIVVRIYSNLKKSAEEVSRRRQKENAVSEGSTGRKIQWEIEE